MFVLLWLKRFFLSKNRFIRLTPLVSILSLVLAVASLILAMSVYSGYESTVRKGITDMTAHLIVDGVNSTKERDILIKLKSDLKYVKSYTAFISLKSLMIRDGQLSGTFVSAFPPEKIHQTLNLKQRLISGQFKLTNSQAAVIGRGLAKRFNLKVGDNFHIVVLLQKGHSHFENKQKKLYVEGILDFGFHEFNSRRIFVGYSAVDDLIDKPQFVSGINFLFHDRRKTLSLKNKWTQILGPAYRVSDWQNIIKNLHSGYFEAVRKEKFLIFFILMILVLAGAFNVSAHLSIAVFNQIRELSILKVMGASSFFIFLLLIIQGFLISFIGSVLGLFMGWGLSYLFVGIQSIWQIVPADVYKVNTIITDIKVLDIIWIMICSQLVCLISCMWPAWRAFKVPVREGLLYE